MGNVYYRYAEDAEKKNGFKNGWNACRTKNKASGGTRIPDAAALLYSQCRSGKNTRMGGGKGGMKTTKKQYKKTPLIRILLSHKINLLIRKIGLVLMYENLS